MQNLAGIWLFDRLYEQRGVNLTEGQWDQVVDTLEKELQQICGAPNPFGIAAKPHALRLAKHYERIGKPADIKHVIQTYGNAVRNLADKAQGLVAMCWLQDVYATYLQFRLKDEAEPFQIAARRRERMAKVR